MRLKNGYSKACWTKREIAYESSKTMAGIECARYQRVDPVVRSPAVFVNRDGGFWEQGACACATGKCSVLEGLS